MDGPRVRGEDVVRRQMQLLGHFKALGLIPQDFSDFKKFQHILDDPVLSGILQNKVKEHLALQKQELAKRNASLPSPRHKVPSHFVRQAKRNSAITQVGKPSKIPQKDDDLAKSIQLDDGLDRYLRQRSFQAYRSSVDTGRKTASKLNRTIDFSRITQPDIIIKKYELQKAPPDQPKKK